jgi:polyisoprenoid-binding protein YceI
MGGGGAIRTQKADSTASHVRISIPKATAEHTAHFERFDATAEVAGVQLHRLEVTIQMDSLKTDTDQLTWDLSQPEFLDTKRFPTAHFESTSVEAKAGPFSTHEIVGTLQFHGVEQEVRSPATLTFGATRLTGDAEITIDPESYGIDNPALEAEMVDEGVTIAIHLEFPFKEESP